MEMMSTTVVWLGRRCIFCLYLLLVYTEERLSNAKEGSNRFDLVSKPSRETRSPKNSDPGVKHDICKVIGSFASIGVQSALSAIKTTKHHMMSFGQSQAWNHSTSSKADLGNFNGNQTSRFRKRTRAKESQEWSELKRAMTLWRNLIASLKQSSR